jgi:hypothetical protein
MLIYLLLFTCGLCSDMQNSMMINKPGIGRDMEGSRCGCFEILHTLAHFCSNCGKPRKSSVPLSLDLHPGKKKGDTHSTATFC